MVFTNSKNDRSREKDSGVCSAYGSWNRVAAFSRGPGLRAESFGKRTGSQFGGAERIGVILKQIYLAVGNAVCEYYGRCLFGSEGVEHGHGPVDAASRSRGRIYLSDGKNPSYAAHLAETVFTAARNERERRDSHHTSGEHLWPGCLQDKAAVGAVFDRGRRNIGRDASAIRFGQSLVGIPVKTGGRESRCVYAAFDHRGVLGLRTVRHGGAAAYVGVACGVGYGSACSAVMYVALETV